MLNDGTLALDYIQAIHYFILQISAITEQKMT